MSQRAEKYARNMERRTGALEDRADKLEQSRDKIGRKLGEYGRRLCVIEADMSRANAWHENEVEVRRQGELHAVQENRRQRREIERGLVLAILLAVAALIVAVKATGTEREAETIQPTAAVTAWAGADLLETASEEWDPWEFAALYRTAEDPEEKQRIGEALEAQGYFSAAVPLPWEYQDYMPGHYDAGFALRSYTHTTGQQQNRMSETVGKFMAQVMQKRKSQTGRWIFLSGFFCPSLNISPCGRGVRHGLCPAQN